MPKKSTPSFILEFPLATSLSDEARLNKGMFEAGKRLRNTLLQEGLRIIDDIRNDAAWDSAVSVKSLQKNYGGSVGARAPGHFMSELKRKAERAGGTSKSINVRQLKTSQFDHSTGVFLKKKLSERWHIFGDGRGRVQRDVYSAFLALHVVETVDADGDITEAHDRELLEKAWLVIAPVLKSKGLFKDENVNTSEAKAEGDCTAPPNALCQLSSSEAIGFIQLPGTQASRTVRSGKFLKTTGLNLNHANDSSAPLSSRTIVL